MRTIVKSIILVSAMFGMQSCNFFGDKPADTKEDTTVITAPQEEKVTPADTATQPTTPSDTTSTKSESESK